MDKVIPTQEEWETTFKVLSQWLEFLETCDDPNNPLDQIISAIGAMSTKVEDAFRRY